MRKLFLDNALLGPREIIHISDADAAAVSAMGRDLEARVTVTDTLTGEQITVAVQRCGLGCVCARRRAEAPLFDEDEAEEEALRVALETA